MSYWLYYQGELSSEIMDYSTEIMFGPWCQRFSCGSKHIWAHTAYMVSASAQRLSCRFHRACQPQHGPCVSHIDVALLRLQDQPGPKLGPQT